MLAQALKCGLDCVKDPAPTVPFAVVDRKNIKVEVKTVGELEAAHSMTISSPIKGDQGKIIDLIADGVYVQPGDPLIRLDPTPFEEKLEKLQGQVKEHQAYIISLKQALKWESIQAKHKNRTAALELEAAALELDKIRYGDGPQETSRLKSAMQKARLKYEEVNIYSNDLAELEAEGFLNPSEVKQAQKKLAEEYEAYEMAKMQYESFITHVHPMQLKKGETSLKKAQINQDEAAKGGNYNIARSKALLSQASETLADCLLQLREAKRELEQTVITAPTQGMVVLREEYRGGHKRKPRVGDIVVKNQPLIDLPDLSRMVIKTKIREVDLYKIAIGKSALIEVDAYPSLTFEGQVTAIGVLALSDDTRIGEEKYFDLHIVLNENDQRLRPGMTARATIHSQEEQNTLTIPIHSVFEEGKQPYCYIQSPSKGYEKRNLSLGINNEQWTEVKEGLEEGECVCLINPYQ